MGDCYIDIGDCPKEKKNMKNRKRLFLSLLIILVVGGAATAGTLAFFTARRTTSNNKFTAGTLDLNVSSNGQAIEPFVIENIGATGDISGTKVWTVKNTGTLPGRLLVRIKNLNNEENGCNDQELEAEASCSADLIGELGNVVDLKMKLNGTQVASSFLANAQQAKIGADWKAMTPKVLQPGEEVTVGAEWAAGENSYGNEVQSDSVKFDMDFRLIQDIQGDIEN